MDYSVWNKTELYKGNFTFLLFKCPSGKLFENLKRTEPEFVKQYFIYITNESKNSNYTYDSDILFNQNQFKKDLNKYLHQISNEPILTESYSSLEVSKDDFIDFSQWSLKLYVSNEILIQVYEKYFKLINGYTIGDYTWRYFKQPLTLNFIKIKILVEENDNRTIMCNSDFSKEINQYLWHQLYENSLGIYDNHDDCNLKADSYPNIDNSMKFIQKFKDELDWVIVQSLYPIYFTKEFLYTYRNYLIFHNYDLWLHEGIVFYSFAGRKTDKMEVTNGGKMTIADRASSFVNRKGKEFKSIENHNVKVKNYPFVISESNNVIWSSELLIKLKDYFSWHLLSGNKAIPWSIELLIAFRDKWDFRKLSSNRAIRWTYEAIEEFKNELCFELLSSNTNVDWNNTPYLSKHYKKEWNWNEISNNTGINEDFVNQWENQIIFADNREGLNWNKRFINVNSSNFNDKKLMKPKLSLSSNEGLIWTDSLIQSYIKKIDFWLIALRGRIDSNLVMKYAAFFNESREIGTYYQKNSDWPSIIVHKFASGWQNLKQNPNFHPSKEFINFSKTYITRIYMNYYDDTGPFHKIEGFVDPHTSCMYQDVSVYSIFNSKLS